MFYVVYYMDCNNTNTRGIEKHQIFLFSLKIILYTDYLTIRKQAFPKEIQKKNNNNKQTPEAKGVYCLLRVYTR